MDNTEFKERQIFFITHTIGSSGGFNRVISIISKELIKLDNVRVGIIYFSPENNEYNFPEHVQKIYLNLPASQSFISKAIRFIKRLIKLTLLKSKNTNEAVYISNWDSMNFINIISTIITKKGKVIIRDDKSLPISFYYSNSILKSLIDLLIRKLYRKADMLLTNNTNSKLFFTNIYNIPEEKIKVIYNPYPIEEIRESAKEPVEEVFEKAQYIITTGRLTKQKGQWYLLRVFKELKRSYPELKLLILGDGELKSYLVELSENLGLETFVWDRDKLSENFDVYFLGFKKNPFKYVSRARLFVFPSLWEGFPNALVEAMACGVPVISSDCRSGPREILAPKTDFRYQTKKPEFAEYGVLMPVFEDRFLDAFEPLTEKERLWVEVIKKMLEDENLRKEYSEKALKRAYDFHVDKIIKEWEEIIE